MAIPPIKRALITGITGQDGSYLAELLLAKGYEVHGLVRRVALESPAFHFSRLTKIMDRLVLHSGSIDSFASVFSIMGKVALDECYHLAAQSFVGENFCDGFSTINTNINGTHYLLESIRQLQPKCRFYFAGSSEMFGRTSQSPQNEQTRFCPRSPYGLSKVAGFELTRNYREIYGLFCTSGILYNHESPRRGLEFVTRKISSSVARIFLGLEDTLELGILTARRDWGFAPEYVEAMHLMMTADQPDDYVIATGKTHSVQDFCDTAFAAVGLEGRKYLKISDNLKRAPEDSLLVGDSSKAFKHLGWQSKCGFEALVKLMVNADVQKLQIGRAHIEDAAQVKSS